METRGKSHAEFRAEVQETLATHESRWATNESRFEQILTELQALRLQQTHTAPEPRTTSERDVNPFSTAETSHSGPSAMNSTSYDRSHQHLKLNFPTFAEGDPTGWIFKSEQYFDFKGIKPQHQV